MIQLPSKENCCGCMACNDICPKNAISLTKDENGFIYPSVDGTLCVDCGLCINNCCFENSKVNDNEVSAIWAYRVSDKKILNVSTSGGAFTALSDLVLQKGGLVAACIMGEDFIVSHILTNDTDKRDKMRRSKYVQSNTEGIFKAVKSELKKGLTVLFVGTPCQTAQMVTYAGSYRENLIACDFLCHGVPNNDFFKAHIAFLEKKYGRKAENYYFRGKKYGWNHMLEEVAFNKGYVCGDKAVQAYSKFFYSGVSLRPSCYNCRYRSTKRASDITIGDFWGIDKIISNTDNRGYSMLAVNTEKGKQILEDIGDSGEIILVDKEKVISRIEEPISKCKIDNNIFWDIYHKYGYEGIVNKYTDTTLKGAFIHKVKKFVKRILK